MGNHISPGNANRQPKIFPPEILSTAPASLQCGMGTKANLEAPEIHLGDWLDFFEMKVGEAAEVAGCHQSYISNIIAGRRTDINVVFLLRLSEHLGITVNDFYRPLPSKSQLTTLKNLSPKAQATILARQQRKA
jgi:plasmid maintenance system antidote protein VapI